MIASNLKYSTQDRVQWKIIPGKDLFLFLLRKLNQIGPVQKTVKEISVALENRKMFATVLIRDRSIKLVVRADHKILSPRVLNSERVAVNRYDHTILIESKDNINEELLKWLEDAYQISN